jgi:hypothetical protein
MPLFGDFCTASHGPRTSWRTTLPGMTLSRPHDPFSHHVTVPAVGYPADLVIVDDPAAIEPQVAQVAQVVQEPPETVPPAAEPTRTRPKRTRRNGAGGRRVRVKPTEAELAAAIERMGQ